VTDQSYDDGYKARNDSEVSEDGHYYNEYSFHTPTGVHDKEGAFVKTAEFEGLLTGHKELHQNAFAKKKAETFARSPMDEQEKNMLKGVIEGLNEDNKVLSEDVQDFKKMVEFLVGEHKRLKV
jgi:hypothetical protein